MIFRFSGDFRWNPRIWANFCRVLSIPRLHFECKTNAVSLIFTILMIFAGVQYRIFRKMTQFWSVRNISLRFLRVFNFPIRCGSVLIMSLQNSLQISCDFQVFRRFSMKSTNLNALLSRSKYNIAVFSAKSMHFRCFSRFWWFLLGSSTGIFAKWLSFGAFVVCLCDFYVFSTFRSVVGAF